MRLRDTLSALPAVFLFGLVGCGYVVSQQEEEPTHTTITISPETPEKSQEPTPSPSKSSPATKSAIPTPGKNEVRICLEIFEKTPVTVAMSQEIERIRKDYAYICDIDWDLFTSDDTWGQAWTPGGTIDINKDFEFYRVYEDDTAEDLEFQVKETVRHEFGHQVIFQHFGFPGQDDLAIRKIFGNYQPDPIAGEVPSTYTADELAADIIAATLNPDSSSPYVTRYDADVIKTARTYLDDTERIS